MGPTAGIIAQTFRRPLAVFYSSLLIFGMATWFLGDAGLVSWLSEISVHAVFIIPGVVGLSMLLLTQGEVKKLHSRFDGIDDRLESRFDKIDDRLESRFDKIDAKLEKIDTKLDSIDTKLDKLDKLDEIVKILKVLADKK